MEWNKVVQADDVVADENNVWAGYVPVKRFEPEDFEPEHEERESKSRRTKGTTDRLPTVEEKRIISQRLKAFKQDSVMLRAFVLNFVNVDDVKKLTLSQWIAVIDRLDAAVKAGTIDRVVGGAF